MDDPLRTRTLSTGDVMVFNRRSRDLYLIEGANAGAWEATPRDQAAIDAWVKDGKARLFDRATLESVQAATAQIVLLEAHQAQ